MKPENRFPSSFSQLTLHVYLETGIAPGSSMSIGGSNLHEYAIYGLYKTADSESLVEVGYRKRF